MSLKILVAVAGVFLVATIAAVAVRVSDGERPEAEAATTSGGAALAIARDRASGWSFTARLTALTAHRAVVRVHAARDGGPKRVRVLRAQLGAFPSRSAYFIRPRLSDPMSFGSRHHVRPLIYKSRVDAQRIPERLRLQLQLAKRNYPILQFWLAAGSG